MRVLYIDNVPSPYRTLFYNEFGKKCELTVGYERRFASDRNKEWKGHEARNYHDFYFELKPIKADQSKGLAIVQYIKKKHFDFDYIVFSNYVSPSVRAAIIYCRFASVPYCIEYDGGFNKKDSLPLKLYKRVFLRGAIGHFTTSEEHINYLNSLGIDFQRIYKYPFTSISDIDITLAIDMLKKGKDYYRQKLNMTERRILLSVGQFIPRKGFDVLLKSVAKMSTDIGVYIVGGKPTEEYIDICEKHRLKNVHFVDFKSKDELRLWYLASDLFVFPTREDIWGLVINEAMANGLPIITTNRCVAGTELVEDGINGYIIPIDDENLLVDAVNKVLGNIDSINIFGRNSFEKIKEYTIEKMAERHLEILKEIDL